MSEERTVIAKRVRREALVVRTLAPSVRYHARFIAGSLWGGVVVLAVAMLVNNHAGLLASIAACAICELVFLVRGRLWRRYLAGVVSGEPWWNQKRVDTVALLGGFNYEKLRDFGGDGLAEAVFSDENLVGTAYGLVEGWPASQPEIIPEMISAYDVLRGVDEEYSAVLGLAKAACTRCSDEEHRHVATLGVAKCADLVRWAGGSRERLTNLAKFVALAVQSTERDTSWQEVLAQYDRVFGTVKVLETV
jgi:hypothetical protein